MKNGNRILIVSLVALAILAASGCYLVPGTPEAVFHEFQTSRHKEGFLVLPLCQAGEDIVPFATEKVKDKSLHLRLYAISFLGTSNGNLPVPVLESIAKDESEEAIVRQETLKSLFALDEEKGRSAAKAVKERSDSLGSTARMLLSITDHSKFRHEHQRDTCSGKD